MAHFCFLSLGTSQPFPCTSSNKLLMYNAVHEQVRTPSHLSPNWMMLMSCQAPGSCDGSYLDILSTSSRVGLTPDSDAHVRLRCTDRQVGLRTERACHSCLCPIYTPLARSISKGLSTQPTVAWCRLCSDSAPSSASEARHRPISLPVRLPGCCDQARAQGAS